MRVSNPDRSLVGINCRDTAPNSIRFSWILSDDLPVPFHAEPILPLYSLHGKQEWRFQTATVLSEISESRNHMSLAK